MFVSFAHANSCHVHTIYRDKEISHSVNWEWKIKEDKVYLRVDFVRTSSVELWLEVICEALVNYESDKLKVLCSEAVNENKITSSNLYKILDMLTLNGVTACCCAYVTDESIYDLKAKMLNGIAEGNGQKLELRRFNEWQDAEDWLLRC